MHWSTRFTPKTLLDLTSILFPGRWKFFRPILVVVSADSSLLMRSFSA